MYIGKTPKNFQVVLLILRLSLVHKENGGLDVKGLPIEVWVYHHFKKEGPDQKDLCPSNSTY